MRIAVSILAALGLAACASTTPADGPPSGRDCFRADSVAGFNVLDEHTVRVTMGASRAYLLDVPQNVRELDWSQAIALRSDSNWICTGSGLGVEIIGGDTLGRRYQVRSISAEPPSGS